MDAILTGPFGPSQLGPGVTVLGRTQDNQIVVNDAKASSHHAELRSTGQDYTITDLGSTNGTFVNDQQLDRTMPPRGLRSGDRIRIGDTTYTFEVRNFQQPGMGIYGGQGSNPNFAPTQMAQPQYPGTAYGGNPVAQNFPPPQPAADFQQGSFQQYPGQQNSFTPPPPGGSSFNQYNQPTQAAFYPAPPPPQQYNAAQPYGVPPVPAAYPAQGTGMPPPYVLPPTPPKKGGGLRTLLLVSLALIVILGAAATFFIVHNNQVAASNASATATALTATAHSSATAVAQTQATGTAVVQATATAGSGTSQDGAYATGNVGLDDALKDNTGGHQWEENSFCSFNQNVYEIKEPHQNTFATCFAQGTTFSNFSYRVLVTIISGDCSGIAFRGDVNSNKQYYYEVCQDGTYALLLYDGTTDKYLIHPTNSSSIKTGLGKINNIAITANNDTIQLYANSTLVNTAQDATLTSGSVGVVGINHTSSATDTAFAGAKVWTI